MHEVAPRGRRSDSMANHARILEAARSLLAERGLDLEVDDVARRAGVGVGTIYGHFTNRDILVRAVIVQLMDEGVARFRAAAEIEDPVEALRQIPLSCAVDQALFAVFQDPRSAKFQVDIEKKGYSFVAEFNALLAGILERGIQSGAFRQGLDPRLAASAILGSIGSVLGDYTRDRPLDDLVRSLADLHRHMVAATR